jgi:hypothetical protein
MANTKARSRPTVRAAFALIQIPRTSRLPAMISSHGRIIAIT